MGTIICFRWWVASTPDDWNPLLTTGLSVFICLFFNLHKDTTTPCWNTPQRWVRTERTSALEVQSVCGNHHAACRLRISWDSPNGPMLSHVLNLFNIVKQYCEDPELDHQLAKALSFLSWLMGTRMVSACVLWGPWLVMVNWALTVKPC